MYAKGSLRLWLLRVTRSRLTSAWRLLLVVLAVSILAATAVTSLGLLAVTTEQGGVHASLTALPAEQTTIEVDLSNPTAAVSATRAVATKAVDSVLGSNVPATSSAVAYTEVDSVEGLSGSALAYFAQLDGITKNAKLTAGSWAIVGATSPTSPIQVDVPAVAAKIYGLSVGSTFTVEVPLPHSYGKHFPRTVDVVGIYSPNDSLSDYWALDPMHGRGNDPSYPIPDSSLEQTEDAFGPLVTGAGALDAAVVPIQSLEIQYVPEFTHATVDDLVPLLNRLGNASDTITAKIGYISDQTDVETTLAQPLSRVASNLVVTRSTVVVIVLLLLVLAIAALAGTARLLGDARQVERSLMRARGASRSQILALAILEAVAIAVLTTVIAPFVARLTYGIIAEQPAMVAASMPGDSGLPSLGWELSGGVGLLFAIVLILPLLVRPGTFVDGEQSKSRQRRASGIMRSGLDIGVVVIAAIVYWQLQTYRTPVGSASLSVDPVLVAAPAIVLLAGALVAVRLVPLIARLAERWSNVAVGAVVPLAAWEIGRRSQRAIAAILLLTIAISVGTFSASFLATWRQSQVDQATLAVGPPVRVPVDSSGVDAQQVSLAKGAIGEPQPVLRRVASVVGPDVGFDANEDAGPQAVVLGLTARARDLIDQGRLAGEGGSTIVDSLKKTTTTNATSISLPGKAIGLSATVQVATPSTAIPGVSADIVAIIQENNGLLSTVNLGSAPVDGLPHQLAGMLPAAESSAKFLGFQAFVTESNRATYESDYPETPANILVKGLGVLHANGTQGGFSTQAISPSAGANWYADAPAGAEREPTVGTVPAGWQLNLEVVIPSDVGKQSATFVLMGWAPVRSLPAVVQLGLAKSLSLKVGRRFALELPSATVAATVAGTSKLIPGSADYGNLTAATASGADSSQTSSVVVDLSSLERALVQAGQSGTLVDEWWVDVASGDGARYVANHPVRDAAQPPVSREILAQAMQQDPLRIETQAALWLAIIAAAILAAVGFAVHTAASMRSRRVEFAQLRAVGLSRRRLVGLVAVESFLLWILGSVFGVGVGVLLGVLAGPLVAVSPDGTPAVPSVTVILPWLGIAELVLAVAFVLGIIVLFVAGDQRRISPASILRGGDE